MNWGLKPKEGEAKDGVHWGARAIFDNRSKDIDLLWDRQSWYGLPLGQKAPDDFVEWLNEVGLPGLKRLVRAQRLEQDEDLDIEFSKGDFVVVCNPKKSFGYLYLGAWRKA